MHGGSNENIGYEYDEFVKLQQNREKAAETSPRSQMADAPTHTMPTTADADVINSTLEGGQ